MKINNPFYKKIDKISLNKILKILKFSKFKKKIYLKGINDLINATQYEISFFNSLNCFMIVCLNKYYNISPMVTGFFLSFFVVVSKYESSYKI